MKQIDRISLDKFALYHRGLNSEQYIDSEEAPHAKEARIKRLESEPEEWFKYYFQKYMKYPAADFQKKATKRLLKKGRRYEVRAWARGFAKSTRTMMEVLYMALTGKIRSVILVSHSADNAERLLLPYLICLETNNRIKNDYGPQQITGQWTSTQFTARCGCSFLSIGAGQNPRGARNEEIRPDMIIIDDIDSDEDCRNPRLVQQKWEWIEQALIPTVDISENYKILFCGNIIAKDSCIVRAIEKANFADIVNICDENGNSNWNEKVSNADIEDIRHKISYISFEKEYMNNPISQGTVFPQMSWKQCEKYSQYNTLVCYTDPSYKDSRKNDYKATVLVGRLQDEFHILEAFVEQTTTSAMVAWCYEIYSMLAKVPVYFIMEGGFMQDTIIDEFYRYGLTLGKMLPIRADDRKKPNKYTRIESLLEPLNRNGKLYLNEAKRDNPHFRRLEEQFKAFQPGSRAHDDAPDAVEGAIWYINNRLTPTSVITFKKNNTNNKRF
ncbi:MAG: hypothetical protein SNJ71_00095 [Bacteroidales bacterium]